MIINVPKSRITNYDEKDAFLYNHDKCPTKDYNDYRCPTKDELPIILRETLRPCAVLHLISENITFLATLVALHFTPVSESVSER